MMPWRLLQIFMLHSVATAFEAGPRLPVPEFEVNLDLVPEQRFTQVIQHFNESLWTFFGSFKSKRVLEAVVKKISSKRGLENENAELQGEIKGYAQLSGLSEEAIHAAQMLYEFNTLMVPFINISWPWSNDVEGSVPHAGFGEGKWPWLPLHFGCTGIVAVDNENGTVTHARNLDFDFAKYLQPLIYVGIFTSAGKEVFRAQMIAGYSAVLTGMRKGPNGYTIEINTRFMDRKTGAKQLWQHLFTEKRDLSGWIKRKVLQDIPDYEGAVHAFSTTPYAATEYNIISGVKKGTILAREPDGLAYDLPLDKSKHGYVIVTNFDYIWHDIREHFDPTSTAGFGRSRRVGAQKILDKTDVITPQVLFEVINNPVTLAKATIFQAVMSVETGLWNVSLPACRECGRGAEATILV